MRKWDDVNQRVLPSHFQLAYSGSFHPRCAPHRSQRPGIISPSPSAYINLPCGYIVHPSPVYSSDLEAAVLAQRFVLVPSLRSLQNKYPHHDVPSQRSTFDISLNFTCCLHERRQQAIKSSPSLADEGHSIHLTDRPRGRRMAAAQV